MAKRGKKLNGGILSVRDFPNGVEGTVGELTQLIKNNGEFVQGKFGQDLWTLAMLNEGVEVLYWADGGIRGALALAKVKPGDKIAIVHTGETTMEMKDGGTGRVQTYDLYSLE